MAAPAPAALLLCAPERDRTIEGEVEGVKSANCTALFDATDANAFDEHATDRSVTDGNATDGEVKDVEEANPIASFDRLYGHATDSSVTEGNATDGNATDGEVKDVEEANPIASFDPLHGHATDGNAFDEHATDRHATDGNATEEFATNGEVQDMEEANPTALSDAFYEDADESATDESATDDSATDGSATDESTTDKNAPDDFDLIAFLEDGLEPEQKAMRDACISGNFTAVQNLVQTIDERVDKEQLGATGLYHAIIRDDAIIARYLLSNLISMNSRDFEMAAEHRAYSVLQIYIDRGWDVNTYSSHPPALAFSICDIKLMLWFLSHGADPNATGDLDITPLSIAVHHAPFEIIRILFDHGGSVEHGQLLHCASNRKSSDRNDVLEYLLDKGAPINDIMYANSPDSFCRSWVSGLGTPLHFAARNGYLDTVNMLLSKGADPLIKSSQGELAIEEAEYFGHGEVVDRLRSLP